MKADLVFIELCLATIRVVVRIEVAETLAESAVLPFGFQDAFLAFFRLRSSTRLIHVVGGHLGHAVTTLFGLGHLLGMLTSDLKIRTIAVISWHVWPLSVCV